ncbi:MAG: hypothetical protein R2852_02890 [Bacteroidia bacterium]
MRKNIYTITSSGEGNFIGFCLRKATSFLVVSLSMVGSLLGQVHDHDLDTLKVLSESDFDVTILNSPNNQLQLEFLYKLNDSITPIFFEVAAKGFQFTPSCILNQSINNVNVESNIEKVWGPQFVSLGVGNLPPNGRFVANLALLNELPPGSSMRVRIYGEVDGQDILWSKIIKK